MLFISLKLASAASLIFDCLIKNSTLISHGYNWYRSLYLYKRILYAPQGELAYFGVVLFLVDSGSSGAAEWAFRVVPRLLQCV
jgi:hypothetical protein